MDEPEAPDFRAAAVAMRTDLAISYMADMTFILDALSQIQTTNREMASVLVHILGDENSEAHTAMIAVVQSMRDAWEPIDKLSASVKGRVDGVRADIQGIIDARHK